MMQQKNYSGGGGSNPVTAIVRKRYHKVRHEFRDKLQGCGGGGGGGAFNARRTFFSAQNSIEEQPTNSFSGGDGIRNRRRLIVGSCSNLGCSSVSNATKVAQQWRAETKTKLSQSSSAATLLTNPKTEERKQRHHRSHNYQHHHHHRHRNHHHDNYLTYHGSGIWQNDFGITASSHTSSSTDDDSSIDFESGSSSDGLAGAAAAGEDFQSSIEFSSSEEEDAANMTDYSSSSIRQPAPPPQPPQPPLRTYLLQVQQRNNKKRRDSLQRLPSAGDFTQFFPKRGGGGGGVKPSRTVPHSRTVTPGTSPIQSRAVTPTVSRRFIKQSPNILVASSDGSAAAAIVAIDSVASAATINAPFYPANLVGFFCF